MIFYFEDLLKTNGICIPRTPIRKLVFEHRWAEAEEIYSQKMRNRSNAQARWDDRREEIKKDWGVDIEYPSFETPRFTTPQEAVAEISKIPAPSSRDLFDTVVDNERFKWVQQLIAEAPADSSLIYVRSTDYYTSTADKYFKERIAAKKEARTSMCGISIVYIGFLKNRPMDELNLKYWSIVKERATVEYV